MKIDLHPRTLRANIWRGLMCASDQEIIDGMDFYPGAHGLCRLFASIYSTSLRALTPSHVAGIYAALSPMNTWDTNVANIVDILRHHSDPGTPVGPPQVNTTNINRDKALAIAAGAHPLDILRGRKVRAFYQCIATPDDISITPAIDRHLINLALGTIPTKNEQSRLASNRDIYTKVEAAYQYLGRREGIGNRLASIAWFVQRRISRAGQTAFYHPSAPICCNRPMSIKRKNTFVCPICRSSRPRAPKLSKSLPLILTDSPIPYPLSIDSRGRVRVQLGVGHPLANTGGWQYLYRYVVESHLGHRLRPDEHVHHRQGIKTDCRLSELEVWLAERHGRHHARTQLLYMFRDGKGRFAPSPVPTYDDQCRSLDYDLDSSLSFSDCTFESSSESQSNDIPF